MPHQCTNCGKVFPDGSKEMLSGCPNCGGNKFQFRPSGSSGSTAGAASSTRSEGTDRSSPSSTSTPTDTAEEPSASHRKTSGDTAERRSAGRETASRDTDETQSVPSANRNAKRSGDAAPNDSRPTEADAGGTASDASAPAGSEPSNASESPTWARTAERAAGEEADDRPASNAPEEPTRTDAPSDATERGGGLSGRANRAGKSVRDWVSSRGTDSPSSEGDESDRTDSRPADAASEEATESAESPPPQNPSAPENSPAGVEPEADREDSAQASARSAVVSPDEIAAAADRAAVEDANGPPTDADGTVIEPESDDRPGLDDLREELNSQFESIKIVAPGEYELNLMELYDRTEYIISLREDGRYVIEVPDSWGDRADDE